MLQVTSVLIGAWLGAWLALFLDRLFYFKLLINMKRVWWEDLPALPWSFSSHLAIARKLEQYWLTVIVLGVVVAAHFLFVNLRKPWQYWLVGIVVVWIARYAAAFDFPRGLGPHPISTLHMVVGRLLLAAIIFALAWGGARLAHRLTTSSEAEPA